MLKQLLEDGFDVTLFERRDKVGGLWAYDADHGWTTALKGEYISWLAACGLLTEMRNVRYSGKHQQVYMRIHRFSNARQSVPYLESLYASTDTDSSIEYPPHLSRGQFQEFMQDYVDHFDLIKYIIFNTSVKLVQRNEDDTKWNLQLERVESGETETRDFDKIVFCHGYQTEKKMPSFPGQETYEGEIVHSQQYRRSVNPTLRDWFRELALGH